MKPQSLFKCLDTSFKTSNNFIVSWPATACLLGGFADLLMLEWLNEKYCTHPYVLAFITYILCKQDWDGYCLVNLIYFSLRIFQIRNLLHCVDKPWWNMPLRRRDMVTVWRTLLLCCYYCDCTQQHYDLKRFEYVLWCHTMHYWVMNINCQTWIAEGRFTNFKSSPLETMWVGVGCLCLNFHSG